MAQEMFGDNGEHRQRDPHPAELQPVSQETLALLLEGIRSRCLTGVLATMGSGGVSIKDVQHNGKRLGIDLYYYGDGQGPSRYDADGGMGADTTGRYKRSHDNWYYDTGVQATIFKTEKADETQADGEKLFTSYTVINNGQQLEIDKRVQPLQLPIFLRLGDELIPKEDNPPLITAQERQTSRRQEDELGVNMVAESEATELMELLRII
jgi:hypothetical protein